MTAVAAALCVARNAALAAIVERHPAAVTLAAQTPCAGATMGGEGFGFDPAGHPELNQLATVVFAKDEFTGTPARGAEIVIDERGFIIDSVAGHLEAEHHWLLRCRRAPGADDA